MRVEFGKGTYFIGDICYALRDNIYNEVWGNQNKWQAGVYQAEGHKFAVANTAWGDGSYPASDGTEFWVDAGVIGVTPKELCKQNVYDIQGGVTVNVEHSLVMETNGEGHFEFHIDGEYLEIDTDPQDDEDICDCCGYYTEDCCCSDEEEEDGEDAY